MTPRLKNRNTQIPNGLTFYLPQVKWTPARYASFTTICQGLLAVIRANPALAKQHGWPSTMAGVEDWVDQFNAQICARMGWTAYIQEAAGSTLPKTTPRHLQQSLASLGAAAAAAKAMVAGARTLSEWINSGEPAVPPEQATARALVCAACPKNEEGDWTKWFTIPAAELIKRMVQRAESRKLTTPSDDRLHLCTACNCPLRLKVHVPIDWIVKRLEPWQLAGLRQGKNCWILSESGLT